MKREPISKALRFQVFQRDGFRCRYCGLRSEETILHVDHRKPVARGGDGGLSNLITACVACNLGKGVSEETLPASITLFQREAAIAAYVFEYVSIHLRIPSQMYWSAWWEIFTFAGYDGCEEMIEIAQCARDWPDFIDMLYRAFDEYHDTIPGKWLLNGRQPVNDNYLGDVI